LTLGHLCKIDKKKTIENKESMQTQDRTKGERIQSKQRKNNLKKKKRMIQEKGYRKRTFIRGLLFHQFACNK